MTTFRKWRFPILIGSGILAAAGLIYFANGRVNSGKTQGAIGNRDVYRDGTVDAATVGATPGSAPVAMQAILDSKEFKELAKNPAFQSLLTSQGFQELGKQEGFARLLSDASFARMSQSHGFLELLQDASFRKALEATHINELNSASHNQVKSESQTLNSQTQALKIDESHLTKSQTQELARFNSNFAAFNQDLRFRSIARDQAFFNLINNATFRQMSQSHAFLNLLQASSFQAMMRESTFRGLVSQDRFRDALLSGSAAQLSQHLARQ